MNKTKFSTIWRRLPSLPVRPGFVAMILSANILLLVVFASSGQPFPRAKNPLPPNYFPSSSLINLIEKRTRAIGGNAEFTLSLSTNAPQWHIDLSRTRASANDLKGIIDAICGCTITYLSLRKTDISDDLVDVIDACKPLYFDFGLGSERSIAFDSGISSLDISYSNVTTSGINRILRTHRSLYAIDLSGLALDSSLFSGVGKAKLRVLSLARSAPPSSVAPRIAELPLWKLDLSGSTVDDEFISRLVLIQEPKYPLTETLEEIKLSSTRITNQTLQNLGRLLNLRRLDLSQTKINDRKSIAKMLSSLKFIQEVNLCDTAVSAFDLRDLKNAYPSVRIFPR